MKPFCWICTNLGFYVLELGKGGDTKLQKKSFQSDQLELFSLTKIVVFDRGNEANNCKSYINDEKFEQVDEFLYLGRRFTKI